MGPYDATGIRTPTVGLRTRSPTLRGWRREVRLRIELSYPLLQSGAFTMRANVPSAPQPGLEPGSGFPRLVNSQVPYQLGYRGMFFCVAVRADQLALLGLLDQL